MVDIELEQLLETCFDAPPAGAAWQQFDIGLARAAGDARESARRLFAEFLPWWREQAASGQVTQWFFMRKPPDVRLRVLCAPSARPALERLAVQFMALASDGVIASVSAGVYLPEAARFGGAPALDCAHAWFTLDSLSWWLRDELTVAGHTVPSAETWLVAVYQDLFDVLGATDGWQRLAAQLALPSTPGAATRPDISTLDTLRADTASGARVRALAAAYHAGNRRFAAALSGVAPAPTVPRAEVAALVALFSFNRHGFAGERSRPLVNALLGLDQNGR